jgi:acetoin:2,6-dichlorophenolindophenol oxidoreductase subunit beta
MSEQPTMRLAIRAALTEEMRADPEMIIMGEVVTVRGGTTYVLEGMVAEFGTERMLETPVSENAILGSALGAALAGMRMVPEIFSADFLFATGNEIWNDISKWRYQHRFEAPIHLVVRAPNGSPHAGAGPEHSQSMEAYLAHSAGLTVVSPSTANEAHELMHQALHLGDPVVYLEHRRLYDQTDDLAFPPMEPIKLGVPAQYTSGNDVTIVAWAWMFQEALQAAKRLRERGVGVDLFSLHTVKPFDFAPIAASIARTGKLLVVEEGPRSGGLAGELIAHAYEAVGDKLHLAKRLTMPDVISPFSPALETPLVPDAGRVLETVDMMLAPSKVAR